jgi:hypothetical protein
MRFLGRVSVKLLKIGPIRIDYLDHSQEALAVTAAVSGGVARGKVTQGRLPAEVSAAIPAGGDNDWPYAAPHFWAAFVLAGDPD